MEKVNIIYISKLGDRYLWNGADLDKLNSSGKEVLLYSGKSIKEESAEQTITDVTNRLKQLFPDDEAPRIKKVTVKIS